jgi:diacylglycerol kinase family enzyme
VGLVAVAGGDGTNHLTISGLVEAFGDGPLPYFGMLRGGTMNTVANSFGIPRRTPEELLAAYKRAYLKRTYRPLRFVEPNVMRVGAHCGFIFGVGAIVGFIDEYERGEDRSPTWAAQVLARGVGSAIVGGSTGANITRRWKGSVRFADGSVFPELEYFAVGASTCSEIGLGFTPFYRSAERPDHFHILGFHCTTSSFIAALPRIWLGRSTGGERVYEKLVTRATVVPSDGRIHYMLDGDLYDHEGPLDLACGPRLRIVIPD